MRVLDVGSGADDVAILLSGLVGPKGEIVGTDLALTAIEAAEERVKASSLANVTFRHGDPTAMLFDKPFDAVVGRYVLQFIPTRRPRSLASRATFVAAASCFSMSSIGKARDPRRSFQRMNGSAVGSRGRLREAARKSASERIWRPRSRGPVFPLLL